MARQEAGFDDCSQHSHPSTQSPSAALPVYCIYAEFGVWAHDNRTMQCAQTWREGPGPSGHSNSECESSTTAQVCITLCSPSLYCLISLFIATRLWQLIDSTHIVFDSQWAELEWIVGSRRFFLVAKWWTWWVLASRTFQHWCGEISFFFGRTRCSCCWWLVWWFTHWGMHCKHVLLLNGPIT